MAKFIAWIVIVAGLSSGFSLAARAEDRVRVAQVESSSRLGALVSAQEAEQAGREQYRDFLGRARDNDQILRSDDPRVGRVVEVAGKLLTHANLFNPRAEDWSWEVNVIKSRTINAFCMPGGKIAIFTGTLDRLELSDDETAAILGHEIAHAVHEHARERMAAHKLTSIGIKALEALGRKDVSQLARQGANLLRLKFSRDDEIEADLVGMELAARAGFDPRAAITLWEKMSRLSGDSGEEFLSSHPSWERRIETIESQLDDVMPIYREAVGELE